MYGSGSHIFAVWSYVIAHTKPDAMVELNPMELASKLGEDLEKIEAAIEHFKSPDPKSRSKEFEGRRLIQKGEFIYFVPQYHKYHGFANNKERREYFAQKKREQRQRDKDCQTVKSKESRNVKQSDTDTNSETTVSPNGDTCPSVGEIYDAYPRHEKKPQAITAILKALKKFPADFVLERTKLYATTRPAKSRYTPLPASWFNAEQFNDDPSEWCRTEDTITKPKESAPVGEAYRAYDPNRWFKEEMEEHDKRKKSGD